MTLKPIKLDKRDNKLLALLRHDARMPIATIARQLGVNRDTVKYRMQRLERGHIISKYYAEIDRSVFGYLVCYVFLLLDEKNKRKKENLLRELLRHPNTEALREYTGNWDCKWVLIARHVEELDDIIMRISTTYSGVIVEKDTLIVVRWSRATWEGTTPQPDVNDKDLHILKLLSDDARTNAVNIGSQIGLSADAVIKRIKRLENDKIIRRYTINTIPEATGRQWFTFVLQMKQFDETQQNKLKEFVRQRPDIIWCYKTIGTWDIVLTSVVDDATAFHKLFKDLKATFSDVLRNYDAYPGYREQFISSLPRIIWETKLPLTTTKKNRKIN